MTLLARDYKDPKCVQIADLHYYNMDMPNRIYSPEGISPTLKTVRVMLKPRLVLLSALKPKLPIM